MNLRKLFLNILIFLFYFVYIDNNCYSYSHIASEELTFDGKDDIAAIYSKNFVEDNQFAIELLVKINSFNSYKSGDNKTRQFIIFKKNSLEFFNECFAIYLDEIQKSFLVTIASSEGKQIHLSTDKNFVDLGVWYHLLFISDGKKLKFYANGDLQAEKELLFAFDWSDEPIIVGGRILLEHNNQPYDGRLNGVIKYIRIYDKIPDESMMLNSYIFNNADYNKINSTLDYDIFYLNKTKLNEEADFGVKITPNPVQENSKLCITLNMNMTLSINIYSINGSFITEVFSGFLIKGNYQYFLNNIVNKLNSGVYFCKVLANTSVSIPFVIIK